MRKGVRIASPCSTAWDEMSGDDKMRFCHKCQLHVYNFAEMPEAEVNGLLGEREGSVCAKIYQRACGSILTKDSPVAFRVLPLLPGITDKLRPETVDLLIGKPQQILPETRRAQSHPGETGITLLAYDPMGSAAADIPFFVRGPETHSRNIPIGQTDAAGRLRFTELQSGSYSLGCGDVKVGMAPQTIEVREGEVIAVEVELFSAIMGMVIKIDVGIVPHQE
jgi:hypothetical protein